MVHSCVTCAPLIERIINWVRTRKKRYERSKNDDQVRFGRQKSLAKELPTRTKLGPHHQNHTDSVQHHLFYTRLYDIRSAGVIGNGVTATPSRLTRLPMQSYQIGGVTQWLPADCWESMTRANLSTVDAGFPSVLFTQPGLGVYIRSTWLDSDNPDRRKLL